MLLSFCPVSGLSENIIVPKRVKVKFFSKIFFSNDTFHVLVFLLGTNCDILFF
nr:MAG TPA: hypothetical protein [Caudoviricetes sp.]